MAIDPNIIFRQDKFSDAFKAGQEIAKTALKNPIELQQSQADLQKTQLDNQFTEQNMPTKLSQEQATLQSTLTSNEAEKLKVAQQKRDMEFKSFLDSYKPSRTQDGQVDAGKLYDDMTQAGFGQYATAHIASQFKNSADQIKNAGDMVKLATDTAKTYSQAISSLPADQRKAAIQKAEDYSKSVLGRSFSEILGPNWAGSSQYMGLTPVEKDTNYRANLEVGNTEEGRDPNSKLNAKWADFLDKNYPDLPKTTLFEAKNLPGFKDVLGSFQISAQERGAAAGEVTAQAGEISDLNSLTTRIKALESKGLWKPGMFVKNKIGSLTNDADRVELQAVADALKARGVDLDQQTSMSGMPRTLEQQKSKAEMKQKQARTVVSSSTRPGTAQAGRAKYTYLSGGREKSVILTPEQEADPAVIANLKRLQAKKVN